MTDINAAVDAAIAKTRQAAPTKVEIDFASFTYGEVCDVEDAIGIEAARSLVAGEASPKAMVGALWIVKRRENPDLTFDDVKQWNIAEVEFE